MKLYSQIRKILLVTLILALPTTTFGETSEITPDIQCIGQTTEGSPLRVTVNLTIRVLTFESKEWPIAAIRYSTNGAIAIVSTEAVKYPGTYISLVMKGTSGALLFYRDGNLKSSADLICQDTPG